MADRFYAKPMRGLAYESLAEWLNSHGDSADTLDKKSLIYEGRNVKDVLELSFAQVEALHASEFQPMVNVFRQDTEGHVTIYRYFPGWR